MLRGGGTRSSAEESHPTQIETVSLRMLAVDSFLLVGSFKIRRRLALGLLREAAVAGRGCEFTKSRVVNLETISRTESQSLRGFVALFDHRVIGEVGRR